MLLAAHMLTDVVRVDSKSLVGESRAGSRAALYKWPVSGVHASSQTWADRDVYWCAGTKESLKRPVMCREGKGHEADR